MKFRIFTTSCSGEDDLLATVSFLKDKVEEKQVMKQYVCSGRVKNYLDKEYFIEISTLEELMKLVKMCDNDIILLNYDVPTIEIYDCFRE